jgi:hypothetical protein
MTPFWLLDVEAEVATPTTALLPVLLAVCAYNPLPLPFCWTDTIWSLVMPLNMLGGNLGPGVVA